MAAGDDAAEILHSPRGGPKMAVSRVVMGRNPLPGTANPAGLALTFEAGRFSVRVSDGAGGTLMSIGPYPEDEVVAVWRSLAAASGLPLLVTGPDGSFQQSYCQLGRLRLGAAIDRRRLKVLSGRRPRFLVKRKPARMPRRPLIHREREIVHQLR